MSLFLEFVVTRNEQPILFILGSCGATWANEEIVFTRPIEKIGRDLKLFQDGILLTDSRNDVLRIVAHWKKRTLRRLRELREIKPNAALGDVIFLGDFKE